MLVLNTLKKVLMLLNHSPPFIQQVGHHAHKGLGLDLAPLLQFIQVQSKFKPLGSTQKTHHRYPAANQQVSYATVHKPGHAVTSRAVFLSMWQRERHRGSNTHTVWTSVASPASPMYSRSPIGKIFWKSVVTIWAWMPNLLSAAMATQFFPLMAITAPPL